MTSTPLQRVYPVILCGGVGKRLWPLSRHNKPKQFLPLNSQKPLIVETIERFNTQRYAPPTLVCQQDQSSFLQSLPSLDVCFEPMRRNTAAAIVAATLALQKKHAKESCLILAAPADHIFKYPEHLRAAIETAIPLAKQGFIITFGIKADTAKTIYGYIQKGAPFPEIPKAYHIKQFHEKPDAETAQQYIQDGQSYWNAGLFLFDSHALIKDLSIHAPTLLKNAQLSINQAQSLPRAICFAREPFAKIPALPFDKAVMEKTQKGAVLELDTAWSDVGDWNSLWQIKTKDDNHNVCFGTTITQATKNTLVYGDNDTLIATIGIEDTVVIQHDHAVLVAKRNASETINSLISHIEKDHPETLVSQTDYRPWGHYQILKQGQGFLVKQITVEPKGILSLQYHHHRSEHWTIVQGCARITCA